jgi:hypothetical protein
MKQFFKVICIIGFSLVITACGQYKESSLENSGNADNLESSPKADQNANSEQSTKTDSTSFASNGFFEPFDGKIEHIHGIGYAGNQEAPFFATHDGLKVFEGGKWYKTKKENNDYMGFNATESGFYASGHPGEDSELPNPFGIKKSLDFGQTIENLALEGETDFHAMGVGFENNVIFVMNPNKNSLMEANKFYVSEDEAKTWKEVSALGLGQEVMSIAVHPNNPDIFAAAAKDGIYLSKDKGESFELITKGVQGTAVFFTEDELWYGAYNGAPLLVKRLISDGTEDNMKLPDMPQDAVLYLAKNPQDDKEITFVTFNGSIFQSTNGAKSWEILVEKGILK